MTIWIVLAINGVIQWSTPRQEWEACTKEAVEMQAVYEQVAKMIPESSNRHWQFACIRKETQPEEGDNLQ